MDITKREASDRSRKIFQRGCYGDGRKCPLPRRHLVRRRPRAFVDRIVLLIAGALLMGFGWWVAHLQSQRASFEAGRADKEIQLRHQAELNAKDLKRIAAKQESLRLRAEAVSNEKTRFVNNMKGVIREFIDRGHEELIGVREQAIDEVPGEQFLTLRLAGELFRDSGIADRKLRAHYDNVRADLIRQLTEFLYPDASVDDTLNNIAQATEGPDE